MSTTYNIERSLDHIAIKLDKIVELLQNQTPKTNKDLLLETIKEISTASAYNKDSPNTSYFESTHSSDFPTPWNMPTTIANVNDNLSSLKTHVIEKDYLYNSNTDPNFTNNDISITSNLN